MFSRDRFFPVVSHEISFLRENTQAVLEQNRAGDRPYDSDQQKKGEMK